MLARGNDTICALSTPVGVGGISVIRVSGEQAWTVLRALAPRLPSSIESHRAYFCELRDGDNVAIDEGVVLFFAAGSSYTGEETAEISCHGNPLIVEEMLRRLVELGCRPATRGEFTLRAFMNGRIDLAQAEGVLDLIESESRNGRRISLRQLQGALSSQFLKVENTLVNVLAHVEAAIDFSTEDIDVVNMSDMRQKLASILEITDPLVASFADGRKINQGFIISLVGAPNAGKSSLLNEFISHDRAIVSPVAGTTRDVVEASIRLGGRVVHFRDTAGLRETTDQIEAEGIRRSLQAAEQSDLIFLIIDASSVTPRSVMDQVASLRRSAGDTPVIVLLNKSDILVGQEQPLSAVLKSEGAGFKIFSVSAVTRVGVQDVLDFVEVAAQSEYGGELSVLTNIRHYNGLKKVQSTVKAAEEGILAGYSSDIVCLELREGLFAIQELLGKQFEESVIDRIFSSFCIGK
jgi:tRNA modification GTPase